MRMTASWSGLSKTSEYKTVGAIFGAHRRVPLGSSPGNVTVTTDQTMALDNQSPIQAWPKRLPGLTVNRKGPLLKPSAAAQPRRRELVFMPPQDTLVEGIYIGVSLNHICAPRNRAKVEPKLARCIIDQAPV
jgi:hypothetical protein